MVQFAGATNGSADVEMGGRVAGAAAEWKNGSASSSKTMEMLKVLSSRRLNGDAEDAGADDDAGVEVAFIDVSYTVRDRTTKKDKAILDGVTGIFRPGVMTALMGPSGCGKTTLLDVLSGRKTAGQIRGEILYNGVEPTPALLKTRCGYVEQFDTLVPNLTVYEMLLYTAHLKRDTVETKEEKIERVEAVINALRLEEARDVIIGDPLTKGISGGQAKRVNIGLALISQPRVLFLDEPTTGLDSFMANEVTNILRELCTAMDMTICATIHSPTAYSFSQFDELLMLIKGKTVFNGEVGPNAVHARSFFEGQGFEYPQTMSYSVVEWLVDVVSGGYELTSQSFIREGSGRLLEMNGKSPAGVMDVAGEDGEESHCNGDGDDRDLSSTPEPCGEDGYSFSKFYEGSSMCRRVRETVQASVVAKNGSGGDDDEVDKVSSSNIMTSMISAQQSTTVPALYALAILFRFRGLKDLMDPVYIAPRLGDKIVFGFIVMSLFWGVGNDFSGTGVQSTVSVLFMVTALNGFGAASYVPTLVLQRPLFYRERSDGLYGEATYLTFLLGMEGILATVTCSVYCIIVYWAINFNLNFGLLWVIYYISALIGISCAYFFAAVSPNLEVANAVLPIYMVVNLFFAGLFIPIDNLPSYWKWYSYIDFMRFAWGGLTYGQYEDRDVQYIGGSGVLDFFNLSGYGSAWQLVGYLSIFLPVYIVLTYLALRFVNHSKR